MNPPVIVATFVERKTPPEATGGEGIGLGKRPDPVGIVRKAEVEEGNDVRTYRPHLNRRTPDAEERGIGNRTAKTHPPVRQRQKQNLDGNQKLAVPE